MESTVGSPSSGDRLLRSKYEGYSHRLIFSSLCAFMGALSFGFTIGYSSPAIPQMEHKGILNTRELSSLFGSLLPLGAMIGSPLGGFMIDKYGRKNTLMLISIPFAIGWFLILDSPGVIFVMIGRFLTGLGSGLVTVACPVYVAEISTRTLRGTLGTGTQIFITFGIALAYLCGMYITYITMAKIGIIIAIISTIMMKYAPETPRWFLLHDKKKEAIQSLTILRNAHTDVQDECRDLQDGIENTEQLAWSELLTKTEIFRPLKISVMIMIFQQISGINAIMFYAESIFKSAGYSNAPLASFILGLTQFIVSTFACFLMDKAGRRILLMISASIMSMTCFMFAWYYYSITTWVSPGPPSLSWLALTSLVLYMVGFCLGWGPIPVIVMSEIFPSQARGRASSIAMLSNWITAFLVSAFFLSLQEMISPAGTFIMFGVSCIGSIIYVWKAIPETKGKSLEDIEMYFLGKSLTQSRNESVYSHSV